MRLYKSEDSYILIEEEEELGDESIDNMEGLGLISEDISLPDLSKNLEKENYIGGGRKTDRIRRGLTTFDDASITVKPVNYKPFYYLLGKYDEDNGVKTIKLKEDSGVVSNTIQAVSEHPDNNFVRTYSGTVVQDGSISIDVDNDLVVELNVIATDVDMDDSKKQQEDTDILDEEPWSFIDASLLEMFGIEIATVQNLNIDINNNSEFKHFIGGGAKPSTISIGNAEIDVDLTISVDKLDIYQELIDDEEFDITIEFDNGDKKIEIKIIDCVISDAPHDIPIEQELTTDISIEAKDVEIII